MINNKAVTENVTKKNIRNLLFKICHLKQMICNTIIRFKAINSFFLTELGIYRHDKLLMAIPGVSFRCIICNECIYTLFKLIICRHVNKPFLLFLFFHLNGFEPTTFSPQPTLSHFYSGCHHRHNLITSPPSTQ